MDIREVKDLIHEVLQSDISEFELEHSGTRVRLKRGFSRESTGASAFSRQSPPAVSLNPPTAGAQPGMPVERTENTEESNFHIITSPIVGTVYRSPSPGTEPYIKLGDQVEEGSILCIVEAMKLMNEIPSDIKGEIVRIYIETGNPVEFGQKLFAIRPLK